jgi:hypothetical protein
VVAVPQNAPVPLPPAMAAPKIVVLTDEQRLRTAMTRSKDYLKAGRVTEARSVLEDVAKGMNPDVLFALAETFDPLHLRENYLKLARAGDAARAVALYEQSVSKGSKTAQARIDALKAMPGFRATP